MTFPSRTSAVSTRVFLLAAALAGAALSSACANLTGGGASGDTGGGGAGGEGGALCPTGGAEPYCEAGVAEPCYSGPPGTSDVGSCHAGVHTCLPDGSGYGPCSGEVAAPEDACDAANCQGAAACGVSAEWSKAFESLDGQMGSYGLAVDAQGNALVTGYLAGHTDFGDGTMTVDAPIGGFLAKFAPDGALLWSKRLGTDSLSFSAGDVAIDPAGHVIVVGNAVGAGVLDVDGVEVTTSGALDTVVYQFDGDGHPLWGLAYGGPGDEIGLRMAVGPSGEIAVLGDYLAPADDPYSTPNGAGMFLAMVTPSGTLGWERRFGMWNVDYAAGIGVLPWGGVVITGGFKGVVDFGGGALESTWDSVFLARFDDAGNHLWSEAFGGEGVAAAATDLTIGAGGYPVITGRYAGPLDLGGGAFPGHESQPFVARFDPAGGHVWSRALWSTASTGSGERVAAAPDGSTLVAGSAWKLSDKEAGLATEDLFVSRLDPDGNALWGVVYGGPISQYVADIGFDPQSGDVLLTGAFDGGIDLGSGPLSAGPNVLAMFIGKVSP